MGEMPGEVHQYYLAALRSVQPDMADAYENTAHCSVSFLPDTTTLKLVQEWLSGEEITKDALYNLIIGQTVLPSWRRLEALGPFSVEAPQSPEEFACRFRERFPNSRGVVPSHLKQGDLSLLGNGPEASSTCCAIGARCVCRREGRLEATPFRATRSYGRQWQRSLRDVPPCASE